MNAYQIVVLIFVYFATGFYFGKMIERRDWNELIKLGKIRAPK